MAKAPEMEHPKPDVVDCPVLSAWQASDVVMHRLLRGMLVNLPSNCQKIKREHLGENVELLAPIIENLGSSVAFKTHSPVQA